MALLSLALLSCGSGSGEVKPKEPDVPQEPMTAEEAKDVFILHCESCHGMDGKKGVSGAADLSHSKKTDSDILKTIKNGNDKGMMPYDELLTDREEAGLVAFVQTLQQHK
jgi:mono/diheme cytochrome c family protein